MSNRSDNLVIVVIGNAQSGKSTLIQKLTNLAGGIYNDEDLGPSEFQTPKFKVTCYERLFSNLPDVPDEESLRENLENGTIVPDAAILCISAAADESFNAQEGDAMTGQYISTAKEIGIPQISVAINKMDSVLWSNDRFNEIVKETTKIVRHLKPTHYDPRGIAYVPVAAQTEDGLFERSPNMSLFKGWTRVPREGEYEMSGMTLLDVMDSFLPKSRR